MMWGILAVFSNAVVDTFFLSRLGTTPLSAIAFAFPVIMVVHSLSIGLGAGAASVVSRAIGAGDGQVVKRRATDSLILSVVLISAVAAIGVTTIDPVFRALGAEGETLQRIHEYMSVFFIGMPFLAVPMVGNSLIRAAGDARIPGLLMVLAAAINIVLDPILIFGLLGAPRLEMHGAALASVIANGVTLFAAIWVLQRRERLLDWRRPALGDVLSSWKAVLSIGLPAAAANMINPAGIAVVTAMLANYGDQAVAAFGLASRIETISLVAMFAVSATIGPIVGQNYGAGLTDRVRLALKRAFQGCLLWGTGAALILALLAPWVLPLFSDEEDVVEIARAYLWIVPMTYFGYGINITAAAALNSVGRPLVATSLTALRMILVFIPLAVLLGKFYGLIGIFIAAAVANLVAAAVSWLATRRMEARASGAQAQAPA